MPFARKPPTKPLTTDEALQKLEHYCAYQERSPREVRQKIYELGLRGEMAEQLWQVLTDEGFVNEARFAEAYARGKFRINHWGRVRIRQELRMRDISSECIGNALKNIDENEYQDVLSQLLSQKLRHYEGEEKGRDKALASLIRAGFEPELVFRTANNIGPKFRSET